MTTMLLHTISSLPLLSLLPSSSSSSSSYSPVIPPNNNRRILRISHVADDGSTGAFVSIQQAVEEEEEEDSATEVVREFYAGINGRDLSSVQGLISDNCVYEDLIFSTPFIGRKEILDFFQKFIDSISTDLQFVIDDISGEDTSAIGVTWHLEWKGKPFPFSKGCSFYRLDVLNGKRQIVYGRDCVEPATKPGEMALVIIRGVTWLLQQFPQLADQL